jgi:hypothetical protein
MRPRVVIGSPGVLILVDHLHFHEALASIRQCYRHRGRIEVGNAAPTELARIVYGTAIKILLLRSTDPFENFALFCSIRESGPAADYSTARDAHVKKRRAIILALS